MSSGVRQATLNTVPRGCHGAARMAALPGAMMRLIKTALERRCAQWLMRGGL